jgi:hypothetical protein
MSAITNEIKNEEEKKERKNIPPIVLNNGAIVIEANVAESCLIGKKGRKGKERREAHWS